MANVPVNINRLHQERLTANDRRFFEMSGDDKVLHSLSDDQIVRLLHNLSRDYDLAWYEYVTEEAKRRDIKI